MISVINQQNSANYLRVATGGNDPSITRSMRYSQISRNTNRFKTYPIIYRPTIIFNNITQKYEPPYTFDLSDYVSSDSDGLFQFFSSNTRIASIYGSVVTIFSMGIVTVTAVQDATSVYSNLYANAVLTITSSVPILSIAVNFVTKISYRNVFCSYGDAPFYLNATSNSPCPITYTPNDTSIVDVIGNMVYPLKVGVTEIIVSQDYYSNPPLNYSDASITILITVKPIKPTVSNPDILQDHDVFSINYNFNIFNGKRFISNSDGVFSYFSYDANIATIDSSGWVTTVHPGTTIIYAIQEASGNYTATTIYSYLNVYLTDILLLEADLKPNIKFNDFYSSYGDVSFYLNAISDSPSPITYTSNDTSIATISGNIIYPLKSGITSITASQAFYSNPPIYYRDASLNVSFTVNQIEPTISNPDILQDTNIYGIGFNFNVLNGQQLISNSDGAFTFSSYDTNIAIVDSSGWVTTIYPGTTLIYATQEASGNYTATTIHSYLNVFLTDILLLEADLKPNIKFNDFYSSYGDVPFYLNAISDSPSPITYTLNDTSIATINGNIIYPLKSGITSITASQAFYSNPPIYYRDASLNVSFAVNPIEPTITNADILQDINVYGVGFNFNVLNGQQLISNSDGAFTYSSYDTNIAIIDSSGWVTTIYPGTTLIYVTQEASGNYTATTIHSYLNVFLTDILLLEADLKPNIKFNDFYSSYGDMSFYLNAISDSPSPITYTSNDTSIATISGNIIYPLKSGITSITASQAFYSNPPIYYRDASLNVSFVVKPIEPTITNLEILQQDIDVYGVNSNFNVLNEQQLISNSDGTFTYSSYDKNVAIIDSSGWVTCLHPGTTIIYITQEASGNYTAMTIRSYLNVYLTDTLSLQANFKPNIKFDDFYSSYGDVPFYLNAISDSPTPITYTSNDTSIASISGNIIYPLKPGITSITASQVFYSNPPIYYKDASLNVSFVVNPIDPTITNADILQDINVYGVGFNFNVLNGQQLISNSDGAFTYSSYDKNVAIIDSSGWVTTIHPGRTIIYVTQEASGIYAGITIHSYLNVY